MTSVGLKVLSLIVVVLGAGLILHQTIQYIQKAERDKITIEILEETRDKREVIDEAVKKSKPVDRNDATDSLRWFKDRQGY